MTSLRAVVYEPNPENHAVYNDLYALYRDLHDSFGGLTKSADLSQVMKRLLDIKCAERS
jgi:L-ribulokinase